MDKHRAANAKGSLFLGFEGHLPVGEATKPHFQGSLSGSVCCWVSMGHTGDMGQRNIPLPSDVAEPRGSQPQMLPMGLQPMGMAAPTGVQRLEGASRKQSYPQA